MFLQCYLVKRLLLGINHYPLMWAQTYLLSRNCPINLVNDLDDVRRECVNEQNRASDKVQVCLLEKMREERKGGITSAIA